MKNPTAIQSHSDDNYIPTLEDIEEVNAERFRFDVPISFNEVFGYEEA